MSVTLRRMEPADIAAGLRLSRAAGWNQTESDWRGFLDWNPEGCRAAAHGEEVVGTVATLRFQDRFAWISMLLVDSDWRGRGIGSALLREALRILEDVETARLDATPAGQPVYERDGFRSEYPLVRMRAGLGRPAEGPAASARAMAPADWQAVLKMDRGVFGADRGSVLRYLYESAPEYAFVAEGGGGVRGYSFGRRGFRAEHMGPVAAEDEDTARNLVSTCLGANPGREFSIDTPRRGGRWLPFLESVGFAQERPFVRMFRGSHAWPGTPERVFAIAGPEFG